MKLKNMLKKISNKLDKELLFLRIGIGLLFVYHGFPKVMGGAQIWNTLGSVMINLGITFSPSFWGLMAALSQLLGGISLILGFAIRPALLILSITMSVAIITHLSQGDGIRGASHAIVLLLNLIFLFSRGAGKYSLDRLLFKKN